MIRVDERPVSPRRGNRAELRFKDSEKMLRFESPVNDGGDAHRCSCRNKPALKKLGQAIHAPGRVVAGSRRTRSPASGRVSGRRTRAFPGSAALPRRTAGNRPARRHCSVHSSCMSTSCFLPSFHSFLVKNAFALTPTAIAAAGAAAVLPAAAAVPSAAFAACHLSSGKLMMLLPLLSTKTLVVLP